MRKRELKNMEWWVLIIAIILCSIGLIALFSATQETEHDAFYKQIIWIGISLFVMVIFTVIDYEAIVKASPIFYIVFLILLVAVLFTKPVNGATSWFDIGFFSLQPSEFAKVDENTYIISGSMPIYDVNKLLNSKIPEGDYDTISGYLQEKMGRIPEDEENPIIETKEVTFKIEEYEDRRIIKIKACRNNTQEQTEE